jgi:hypothetical protein
MDLIEATAWLRGERSTTNYMPQDPFETWNVRINQADAACTEQAYWIAKAHKECLVSDDHPADRAQRLLKLLARCNGVLIAHGYDENEGIRKEVEDELGYT